MKKTKVWIVTTSIVVGLVSVVVMTELLDRVIWPSLLVGVPSGVIASIVSYFILRKAIRSH